MLISRDRTQGFATREVFGVLQGMCLFGIDQVYLIEFIFLSVWAIYDNRLITICILIWLVVNPSYV